jgi:hypothetical protein
MTTPHHRTPQRRTNPTPNTKSCHLQDLRQTAAAHGPPRDRPPHPWNGQNPSRCVASRASDSLLSPIAHAPNEPNAGRQIPSSPRLTTIRLRAPAAPRSTASPWEWASRPLPRSRPPDHANPILVRIQIPHRDTEFHRDSTEKTKRANFLPFALFPLLSSLSSSPHPLCATSVDLRVSVGNPESPSPDETNPSPRNGSCVPASDRAELVDRLSVEGGPGR